MDKQFRLRSENQSAVNNLIVENLTVISDKINKNSSDCQTKEEQLTNQMDTEYERMKKGVADAKSRREDGHNKVLLLLQDVQTDCVKMIQAEKMERECTQNGICTLLEETCIS